MWQLRNRTPFAAERTWVRDRDGTETWLVAVKATFRFASGGCVDVADEQPPVTLAPVHHGQPGRSSLRYECDLQRTKVATDVVVNGSAHAPDGYTATRVDAGFAIGPVAKTLRVHGDRRWQRGRIGEARPFSVMPISYERAFGGADDQGGPADWDERNPVGSGYSVSAHSAEGRLLPNLESGDEPIRHWSDHPEPAAFGPIPCHWPARRRYAGTCDERWQRERAPLLPSDFDDRHYQCAPTDQQAHGFLRGDELVSLLNLTPGGGEMHFALPRIHLGLETSFFTGPSVLHPSPSLHTVIIEPDDWRVSLVWHSALPCHQRVLKLRHTVVTMKEDLREGALASLPDGVAA